MKFEGKEKLSPKNEIESHAPNREQRKANFYYLNKPEHENRFLQNHLKYKILVDCIKELGKQEVKVVDYGCGNGRLTNILSTLSGYVKELSNIKIKVMGYEPDEEVIKEIIKRNEQFLFDCARHTSEKPNEVVDIVVCHFSLHHMENDIEKILQEEIKQNMNPQYLIIGEFDYKGHNIAIQEFNNLFLSTENGKDELKHYKEKYGDEEGLQKCYEEHMKIGLQDCVDALEKIGYEVEDIAMGNKKNPMQTMKFLIKARRCELKHL